MIYAVLYAYHYLVSGMIFRLEFRWINPLKHFWYSFINLLKWKAALVVNVAYIRSGGARLTRLSIKVAMNFEKTLTTLLPLQVSNFETPHNGEEKEACMRSLCL